MSAATPKIRRVDLSPSEYVAAVAGLLTIQEYAVYSLVCMMIYERRKPIPNDHKWLARIFADGTDPRTIRAAIEGCIRKGKIERSGDDLMVNRCRTELDRAANRVRTATDNANKRWGNNDLGDAPALSPAMLTINHQPSTSKEEEEGAPLPPTSDQISPNVLIAIFDEERARVYGAEQRRPYPAATDSVTAGRWIDAGATAELCRGVIGPRLERKKSKGEEPPTSLKYFEAAIGEALAERSRPLVVVARNDGGGAIENAPDEFQWRKRVGAYAAGSPWLLNWGPDPSSAGCYCPHRILDEFGDQIQARIQARGAA
jgi:uncharacterized protein YdaU (DUF1376 family)